MTKKARVKVLCIALAVILLLSSLFVVYKLIENATIRLDKIPVVRFFVMELDKPADFDATVCNDIITWDQIDNPPPEFDAELHSWFYLNPYTKWLLKNYMKKNNLGIVPGKYPDFHLNADFDECLETFEFVEVPNE